MIGLALIVVLALAIAVIAVLSGIDRMDIREELASSRGQENLVRNEYKSCKLELDKVRYQLKIANKLAMEREQPRCGVCGIFVPRKQPLHPGLCDGCFASSADQTTTGVS